MVKLHLKRKIRPLKVVTLNNASDYWANGLLSDYIGWTNGLTDYWAYGLMH